MTMYPREEVEAAFAEFRRRGIETHDWSGWAELFTEDALYEEHNLGVFNGRAAIQKWIVECMADYPTMTLWIEWYMIEGNRISFYIWNNLPDPTGTGKRFGFPNTTILEYAGDGKFSFEGDYYNPEDAGRVFVDWIKAGGTRETLKTARSKGLRAGRRIRLNQPSLAKRSRQSLRIIASVAKLRSRLATGTSGPISSPTTRTIANITTAISRVRRKFETGSTV